jgi:PAS domain S-box-containing protein
VLDGDLLADPERCLRELNSPGIAELDGDGRICSTNRALDLLLGHSPGGSVGTLLVEQVATDESARRRWSAALQGDERVPFRARLTRSDGQEIAVQVDWINRTTSAEPRCGPVVVVTDITARQQVEQVLSQTLERVKTLSRQLLEVQEQERRHLARELHDEFGQQLTALVLTLSRADAQACSEALTKVKFLSAQVRDLALRLRPPMLDDLGLLPALFWLLDQLRVQTGLDAILTHLGLQGRLPQAVETAAFRIVQEALTNVVRHAGLVPVAVRVRQEEDRLSLEIEDQGPGFDPSTVTPDRGFGLAGMRERAELLGGTWSLVTTLGVGTCVCAELPIGASE